MAQEKDQPTDYDSWILEQIDEALRRADSPDAVWIPHEEVAARWTRRKTDILAQIAQSKIRK